ncbi:peptidoglycan-binding protein [Leptothoe sp. ISB3NOV94-8A]
MKRWGLFTISNLCLSAAVAGLMSTVVLAEIEGSSPEQSDELNAAGTTSLKQAGSVLGPGSTGSDVKRVQAMLALMGYYSGAVDGTYEQMTLEAVRQFQVDAGLAADGLVGPLTWRRLLPTPENLTEPIAPQVSADATDETATVSDDDSNDDSLAEDTIVATAGNVPILQLDDSGVDVSRLQNRLADLNLYQGPIDGVFGFLTEEAVQEFQRRVGLEVDGVVGPATWSELFK